MRIDPAIARRRDDFVQGWNSNARVPQHVLDGAWPSVGVLDRILFHLRGKERLVDSDIRLVGDIASYLAVMAAECWEAFGAETQAGDFGKGIAVVAASGPALPAGEKAVFEIEFQLAKVLQSTPDPFPVLGAHERPIREFHNLLDMFAIGLFTGLSPFVEGPWLNESADSFAGNIERVTSRLALSSIRHYERLYETEPLGQVGELYLAGLIYPPLGMNEALPAQNAMRTICPMLKDFKAGQRAILQFAGNLAGSPDELMCCAGLALLCALSNSMPSTQALAAAEAVGTSAGLLRMAMLEARAQFALRPDWIQSQEAAADDNLRFQIEKALGFLPWVVLPPSILKEKTKEPRLAKLLEALAFFDFGYAVELCDKLISESPGHIDLRLQRLHLEVLNRNPQAVEAGLRLLIAEPGTEDDPRVQSLWGLCDLWQRKTEDAVRHLSEAVSLVKPSHPQFGQICNDYGWVLMFQGDFEKALDVLDKSIANAACPLTGLLNKVSALRALGRADEAAKVIESCLALSPLDMRVFSAAYPSLGAASSL